MKTRGHETDELTLQLKCLAAGLFRPDIANPGAIADNLPLFGGSLCLDSMDALELAICIEEEFGIAVHSSGEIQGPFASFASLAAFLSAHPPAGPARRPIPGKRPARRARFPVYRSNPSCQSTTPLKLAPFLPV